MGVWAEGGSFRYDMGMIYEQGLQYVWFDGITVGWLTWMLFLVVLCPLINGSTLNSLRITFNNRTNICSLKNDTLHQITSARTGARQLSFLQCLLQHFPQVEDREPGQAGQAQRSALQGSCLPQYIRRYMLAHSFCIGVYCIIGFDMGFIQLAVFANPLANRVNPHISYQQLLSVEFHFNSQLIFIKSYNHQLKADNCLHYQQLTWIILISIRYIMVYCDYQAQDNLYFTLKIFYMSKYPEKLAAVAGKLFINGELVPSNGGKSFDVINPATEQVFCQAVTASQQDVNSAVTAARTAFNTVWRETDAHVKGKIMLKIADLIEENAEWLAYYESLNNGKPLKVCLQEDIPFTAYMYRYFAGQADKIKGQTLNLFHPHIGMTIKQPIGVVGQIIPWNYPLLMMAWKVAPALAAGCTVVLKPAEQTPFTALMLGQIFTQAGLPAGVVNILTGFGQTGSFISTHKGIDKISFTGSTEVGYVIMRGSHKENLKPITLELGGKSANIICHDADLQIAVNQACILFGNNGQSCVAGSRTYVHESIYDKFLEGCIKYAENLKVGDPMDQNNNLGAIVTKEQFERILYYIEEGKKQGATVVAGGGRLGEKGYFIKPTIFTNVQDHMRIARQQIFGPVMSILKWTDEEDVITRANALPYGLGAGVVTPDIDRAIKFVKRLHAGSVYVNCYDYQEASTPFGGVKDSGIGKDLGDQGIQSYLLTKTVIIKQNKL